MKYTYDLLNKDTNKVQVEGLKTRKEARLTKNILKHSGVETKILQTLKFVQVVR